MRFDQNLPILIKKQACSLYRVDRAEDFDTTERPTERKFPVNKVSLAKKNSFTFQRGEY